jgi:hypothetical protein
MSVEEEHLLRSACADERLKLNARFLKKNEAR